MESAHGLPGGPGFFVRLRRTRPGMTFYRRTRSAELTLSQIRLQRFAARCMTETSDRLLLDLSNTFACEIELLSYLFQRHGMFAIEAEVKCYHIRLALCERRQCALHFAAK